MKVLLLYCYIFNCVVVGKFYAYLSYLSNLFTTLPQYYVQQFCHSSSLTCFCDRSKLTKAVNIKCLAENATSKSSS